MVLLPASCFAENTGTLVNLEGKWQSFQAAIPALEEARSGWEILNDFSKELAFAETDFTSLEALQAELKTLLPAEQANIQTNGLSAIVVDKDPLNLMDEEKTNSLQRITEWPLYSIDPLVRRSSALQESGAHEKTGAYIHSDLAKQLNLKENQIVILQQGNQRSAQLPIILNDRLPRDVVWTPAGRQETSSLGPSFGEINIIPIDTFSLS